MSIPTSAAHPSRCSAKFARTLPVFSLLAITGLLAGCSTIKGALDSRKERTYTPGNFVDAGPIPASVRRIGVLPLFSDSWGAADVEPLQTAFWTELEKFDRFETVAISRSAIAARFERESFSTSSALPSDFLARLHDDFGVDAVLFLDLTHYSPYQPIAVGVRAKLATTDNGRGLWSFDCMFDSAQPDVAAAARSYHAENSKQSYPLHDSSAVFQSPARYAKYVAHATFATLPPREHP